MEKVFLLSASPRRDGNTMLLLKECAKVIEAEGVGAEIFSLAGKSIRSCIACRKCADLGECSQKDPVNEIIGKVRESRGGAGRPHVGSATDRDGFQGIGRLSIAQGRGADSCREKGRPDRDHPGTTHVLPHKRHGGSGLQLLEYSIREGKGRSMAGRGRCRGNTPFRGQRRLAGKVPLGRH